MNISPKLGTQYIQCNSCLTYNAILSNGLCIQYNSPICMYGLLSLVSLIFICSVFSGNQVSGMEVETEEIENKSPQSAAISSFRYPLRFTGINQLLDNPGGGLSVTGTIVRVDGSLIVHNNTASRGGGIHLEDLCLVWPRISSVCMYWSSCLYVCVCSMYVLCVYCIHTYVYMCGKFHA